MKVNRVALATLSRLRGNQYAIEMVGEDTYDLGILAIATRGNTVYVLYPDGSVDEKSWRPEECADESYDDHSRSEYVFAVGAR